MLRTTLDLASLPTLYICETPWGGSVDCPLQAPGVPLKGARVGGGDVEYVQVLESAFRCLEKTQQREPALSLLSQGRHCAELGRGPPGARLSRCWLWISEPQKRKARSSLSKLFPNTSPVLPRPGPLASAGGPPGPGTRWEGRAH